MPIDGLPGGDFGGCVRAMRGKVDNPEAFCAWQIHALTGKWPTEESLATCREAEFKPRQYNGVRYSATDKRSSSRDGKKYERTVRYDGKERVVHWGQPGEQMERDNPDARANFNARHNCAEKRDPFTPGFQACYDWQPGAEAVTESLTETLHGTLSIRESQTPNTVLLDGTIIVEGLSGNNNNYTREALATAASVFAEKPIRINHPSRAEDRDRPEGDIWTQVGKLPLAENIKVKTLPDGTHAVKFYGATLSASPPDIWISDRIRAGIIGDMSINAGGEGVREADGTFKVTKFTAATSLDLVTVAAAGGKVEKLTESLTEVDMTPEQIKELVAAQVAEQLGAVEREKDVVDQVMEAQGLPKEFKPLLEAEARRLMAEAEMPDEDEEQEGMYRREAVPEMLGKLPEEQQMVWANAYEQCMTSEDAEEGACSNAAWLSLVMTLATPVEEPEPEMEEALVTYAKRMKAALAKLPGAGQVQGAGQGAQPVQTAQQPARPYAERLAESFAQIPGFTKEMAAIAANGRN